MEYSINIKTLPIEVYEVLNKLESSGFPAFLVGGAVRDIFLGKRPKDYDILTCAKIQQIKCLFDKVVPIGEKHGTVTVFNRGFVIEITSLTYRSNLLGIAGNWEKVSMDILLKDDLSRRDFTINALAAGLDGKVYDYFGGLEDIEKGVIRAVGEPLSRFREDPLRMLRAIRIACKTAFVIDKATMDAIKQYPNWIKNVARERVREELNLILLSKESGRGVDLLNSSGLLYQMLLQNNCLIDKVLPSELKTFLLHLTHSPARLNVRLAVFIYYIVQDMPGSPAIALKLMRGLKYSRKTIKIITGLLRYIVNCRSYNRKEIKEMLNALGVQGFKDLLDIWESKTIAIGLAKEAEIINHIRKTTEEIIENREPLVLKDLAINGTDLKKLGLSPGREMGKILNELLEAVLEQPQLNKKLKLMDLAAKLINQNGCQ